MIINCELTAKQPRPPELSSGNAPLGFRLTGMARYLWLLLLALATSPTARGAQSAFLSWDPSPDPSVVGYNIYYGGESGSYTNLVSVGDLQGGVVSGLDEGATYYFVVTAFDDLGQESVFSNEASYNVPAVQAAQRQISGAAGGTFRLVVTGLSGHTYEIQATTNFSDWTAIGTQTAAADGCFSFVDYSAADYRSRFYRTRDTQP